MNRSRPDARQRVRHAQADVVVRVDSDLAMQFAARGLRDRGDFARQTTAVRVAKHDHVRARLLRRLPCRDGIFGIELVTIETVLGVVNHKLPVILQITHRVADHAEILIRRAAQHFLHVQHRSLAVNRDDRRLRLDEQPHLIVLLDRHALFAGRTERREFRVLEFALLGLREKLDVLRIAARPAALDVMNAELIELVGNAQFVGDREVHTLTLRAIAQGRVIEFDVRFHKVPAKAERGIYPTDFGKQSQLPQACRANYGKARRVRRDG